MAAPQKTRRRMCHLEVVVALAVVEQGPLDRPAVAEAAALAGKGTAAETDPWTVCISMPRQEAVAEVARRQAATALPQRLLARAAMATKAQSQGPQRDTAPVAAVDAETGVLPVQAALAEAVLVATGLQTQETVQVTALVVVVEGSITAIPRLRTLAVMDPLES